MDLGADYKNMQLNYTRAGFFFVFFALSALWPFIGLLFSMRGLSEAQNGALSAVSPLCMLVLSPAACYFAQKHAMQVSVIVATVVISSVVCAPVMCYAESKAVIVVASLAYFITSCPYLPLYDEHSQQVLAQQEGSNEEIARRNWGKFRVYGAYGWLIGSPIASAMMQQQQQQLIASSSASPNASIPTAVNDNISNNKSAAGFADSLQRAVVGGDVFLYAPILLVISNVIFLFSVYKTPIAARATSSHSYLEVMWFVVGSPRIVAFCLMLVVLGSGYAAISTFLFVYLSNELNAPPILMGFSLVAALLVEIPLFAYSDTFLKMFSNRSLLLLAAAGWVVRGVGYAALTNPWFVLLLEPLHGLTFGCMWLGGMAFMTQAFPASMANSAVALLHACAMGAGALLGTVASGVLYESLGSARQMFRLFAAFIAVAALTFYVVDAKLLPPPEEKEEGAPKPKEAAEAVEDAEMKTTSSSTVAVVVAATE